MSYLPFFVELENKTVFVSGNDEHCADFCEYLLRHGALITVWSQAPDEYFSRLKKAYGNRLNVLQGELSPILMEHYAKLTRRPFMVVLFDNAQLETILAICDETGIMTYLPNHRFSEVDMPQTLTVGALEMAMRSVEGNIFAGVLRDDLKRRYDKAWRNFTQDLTDYSLSDEFNRMDTRSGLLRLRRLSNAFIEAANGGDVKTFDEVLADVVERENARSEEERLLQDLNEAGEL